MIKSKEFDLVERLKTYTEILEKVRELLDTMERKDFQSIDSIEEALIPDVRGLGKILVNSWASNEEVALKESLEGTLPKHSKKTLLAYNIWRHSSRRTNIL